MLHIGGRGHKNLKKTKVGYFTKSLANTGLNYYTDLKTQCAVQSVLFTHVYYLLYFLHLCAIFLAISFIKLHTITLIALQTTGG